MNQPIEDPASLLAALNRGESLPAHWYTDPEITRREIHQIFRKTWIYIGPLKELSNQGDYITGSKVEFFRDPKGAVEWMRFGGRIYRRQPND